MSLNKVILIGNAGKAPEVKYLGDERNYKLARFTLATDEWYKDKEGKGREITTWHNIVAWNATADYVEKYIKKGTLLYVEGALRYRTWTGADGVEKSVCEISANDIRILNWKKDEAVTGGTDAGAGVKAGTLKQDIMTPEEDLPTDDIPF